MSAAFVVDSSVVVDVLVPEQGGSPADAMFAALAWPEPVELFAPDLMLLETANALRKLAMRKAIRDAAAGRAVTRLGELPIVTVPSHLVLDAAWALRGAMSLYDAAYAALASELDAPLVTLDARLARGCRAANVESYLAGDDRLTAALRAIEPRDGQ